MITMTTRVDQTGSSSGQDPDAEPGEDHQQRQGQSVDQVGVGLLAAQHEVDRERHADDLDQAPDGEGVAGRCQRRFTVAVGGGEGTAQQRVEDG